MNYELEDEREFARWRRELEEAIKSGDTTHTNVMLDYLGESLKLFGEQEASTFIE